MPSDFDWDNLNSMFPDVLQAMSKIIEGLSELAGLDGFDAIVLKLDEAAEECEKAKMLSLGEQSWDSSDQQLQVLGSTTTTTWSGVCLTPASPTLPLSDPSPTSPEIRPLRGL